MDKHLHHHLTALDPSLGPGNTFDKDNATELLKSEIPQNVWYKIPTALAGNWKIHEATTSDVRDEVTGRNYIRSRTDPNITEETLGYFPSIDKEFWWELAESNYWTKTEGADCDCWFFIKNVEPIGCTYNTLCEKSLAIQFNVDKASKRILKVFQRESLHTEIVLSDNLAQSSEVSREFRIDGKPLWTFRLSSIEKRVSTSVIHPNATRSGRNPTELILAYFQDRGLNEEYQNILRITQGGEYLPASDKSLITGSTFDKDLVMPQLGKNALEKRRSEQSLQQ